MNVKQISVQLNHVPGTLYEMTTVLANNGINIRALTVAQSTDTSTVRIIVDNVIWASSVLRNMGFEPAYTEVIAVEVPNIAGGLNKILEVLKNGYINIEYLYNVGTKYTYNSTCIIFKFSDNEKAVEVLNAAGIKMLGQGDFSAL